MTAAADTAPQGDSRRRVIELDIPSDVRFIERVVEQIQRECRVMAFTPRQVMLNVPVALTEALSNAILRGNADDPSKHVHVRALFDSTCLIVEVEDEGDGFDIDACTLEVTPDTIEREDGRGLFLMRKLMDRVERISREPGNTVRLTLNRA
jgi:serine/threonine-protein kinase RsbW